MSNFADFLKTLDIEVEVLLTSYVYYDSETGKIQKISSRLSEDDQCSVLEVSHDSVIEIINGTKSSENFVVEYDVSLKQLALKELTYEDALTKIDSHLYRLPVVRTIADEIGDKGSLIFDSIYDGVEVFVWLKNSQYYKNMLVWLNNTVYKLLDDVCSSEFDYSKAEVFIENVFVSDVKSLKHFVEYKKVFESIYEGVHVDVWYRELAHFKGQHVWIYNNVYRLKEDQSKDTDFTLDNAEIVETNVYLYGDSNKHLTFVTTLALGDKILDHNKLYLFTDKKTRIDPTQKSILFYSSKFEGVYCDEQEGILTKFSFVETQEKKLQAEAEILPDTLTLTPNAHISNGQKILIGKSLYQASNIDECDFDVNVVQNNLLGCWEIYLGKKTKKALEAISYIGQDTLYFSVTAKHDPNVLYRAMEFSVGKLLSDRSQKYPYQYNWEFDRDDVSVYTSKFFDTYSHEILE